MKFYIRNTKKEKGPDFIYESKGTPFFYIFYVMQYNDVKGKKFTMNVECVNICSHFFKDGKGTSLGFYQTPSSMHFTWVTADLNLSQSVSVKQMFK